MQPDDEQRTERLKGEVGICPAEILAAVDALPMTFRKKYPASVSVDDGGKFPCVLFIEVKPETQDEYFDPIGLLTYEYEVDARTSRRILEPKSVLSVGESPHRTPVEIEEKMYGREFHEAYMGAPFLCKVLLDDETEYLVERGSWETEFVVLPDGIPNSRISDVTPLNYIDDYHRLCDAKQKLPEPEVRYCLFKR